MLDILFLAALSTVKPVAAVEVEASLAGYNLPPLNEARCCSFRLTIDPAGKVIIYIDGHATESQLTPEQLAELSLTIDAAKFFSLPKAVGAMPVDGDAHRMRIRVSGKEGTVTLYDWPRDWNKAGHLTSRQLDETRRAYSVWKVLRALVTDVRATVE